MKYFKSTPFVFACLLLSVMSCKKKADDTPTGSAPVTPIAASFTAQVNDVSFEATHTYGNILGNRITISGSRGKQDFVLSFPAANGNYRTDTVINASAFGNYYSDSSNANLKYRGLSGSIVILSVNTVTQLVSGQFSFIGTNAYGYTTTVTGGSFSNVHYTRISYTNSFSASVDTLPFTHAFVPTGITAAKVPVVGGKQYFINASGNTKEAIGLTLPASLSIGKRQMDSVSTTYYAAYTDTANHYFKSKKVVFSSYTITQYDSIAQIIQGTFQFDATYRKDSITPVQTRRITLGKFNVQYQ